MRHHILLTSLLIFWGPAAFAEPCIFPGLRLPHPNTLSDVVLVPSRPNRIEVFGCKAAQWQGNLFAVKLAEAALSGLNVMRQANGDLTASFTYEGRSYSLGGFTEGLCANPERCRFHLANASDPVVPTWRLSLDLTEHLEAVEVYLEPFWDPHLIEY